VPASGPISPTVELWWGSAAAARQRLPELLALLDADERRRAERFRVDGGRQRFIAAHAMLRCLLGERVGIPPQRIELVTGARGKPALAAGGAAGPHFNLAHSEELAVVALASRELGVDVEALRPFPRAERFAARFFASSEQQWLQAKPDAERGHAALTLWTFKEAYLKAVGSGIAMPLASVEVDPDRPALLQAAGVVPAPGDWTLHGARLPGPAVVAVAIRGSGWRVEVREFVWPRWRGGTEAGAHAPRGTT
jgi:4'-phosphopantetheinyl transferase